MLAANMENTTMRMRIETSLAVKEESSVRRVVLLCIVLLLVLMFPCTERSAAASTGKTVGIDIAFEDITDFFYTYDASTAPPHYQRYRFFAEDGKHYFYHETREGGGWPQTEADITCSGTVELTEEQWAAFCDLLNGGKAGMREEHLESGDAGPWLYIYWRGGETEGREFSFDQPGSVLAFEKFSTGLKEGKVSSRMEKQQISLNGMDFHFWLYTPDNIPEDPALIIYLHGGTSKGDDLDLLVSHGGLPQYLLQGRLKPSVFIAMPQAPEEIRSWDELGEEIIGLTEILTDQYNVDPEKVALTGHSMGGIGTWMIAYEDPDVFCRIAPLSGAISRKIQRNPNPLTMPIWSFVGSDPSDENAYNSNTAFFPELQKRNPDAQLTILENAKHRDVAEAYLQFDIIGWLAGGEKQE